MSEKLRQFTTADGQTIYVKMSRKDYKAAMKAAQEGRPVTLNGNSVFVSAKNYVSRDEDQLTQNQNFAGTSLECGAEKMQGKKDYKARQAQYEQALKAQYIQDGMSEKEAAKIAKTEAKERIEAEKAADEVISAVYFTPDEKDKYKAQKDALEAQGKHAVLLTKDDMKRLGQFDELKGFVDFVIKEYGYSEEEENRHLRSHRHWHRLRLPRCRWCHEQVEGRLQRLRPRQPSGQFRQEQNQYPFYRREPGRTGI